MTDRRIQQWLGVGAGLAVLAGTSLAVTCGAQAQGRETPAGVERRRDSPEARQPRPSPEAREPRPSPEAREPRAPRPFGDRGPRDRPFADRPAFPPGPFRGGDAALTATENAVYVLRGNTLYAFDARTLKLTGRAELPEPERRPRPVPGLREGASGLGSELSGAPD